jgi:hypothetical protein
VGAGVGSGVGSGVGTGVGAGDVYNKLEDTIIKRFFCWCN